MLLELLRNLRLHATVIMRRVIRGLEARQHAHDNISVPRFVVMMMTVFLVHLSALRVRQAPLLQDLKQS